MATPGSSMVRVGLAVWFSIAVALGASGRIQDLDPPGPQLVLLMLTAVTLSAVRFLPAVRAWSQSVDLRWLAGLHLVRFVGIYFLVLYGRGELPYAFAVPGGWGDIIVAALVGVLLLAGPPTGRRRAAYQLWNVVGFADILFVVATAARLGMADATLMAPLLRLPLSLLPTFIVPLIITTHVIMLARLWPRRPSPG